jgi:steroid delta-isomerase-like uncharacterized protein
MTTSTTTVATRVYDLLNKGDIEGIIATLADGYVSHGFGGGGAGNLRQSLTFFRNAFPDVVFTVEDTITEGDKVAVKTTFRATHQGPFAGVPASGRAVEVGGCDVFRIRDGKVAEAWWLGDSGSMLMQIGAVPAPASS